MGTRQDNYYAPDFTVTRVTLPAYTRTDLAAQLYILPQQTVGITATLRAENLFGTHYTDVAGYNYDFARTDNASLARTGYRGAERRLLSGLRVTF